jgi:hypothetical protein
MGIIFNETNTLTTLYKQEIGKKSDSLEQR